MKEMNNKLKKLMLNYSKEKHNLYTDDDATGLLTKTAESRGLQVKSTKISKNISRRDIIKNQKIIGNMFGVRPSSSSIDTVNFVKDINKVKTYLKALDFKFNEQHSQCFYIRINVIEGLFTSATLFLPPFIVGDGKSTIKELVQKRNKKRIRSAYFKKFLFDLDDDFVKKLKGENLKLESIIDKNEVYILRDRPLLTGDAETIDITNEISIDIIKFVEQVTAAIPGLFTSSLELSTENYQNSGEVDLISISASPYPLSSYLVTKGTGVNIYDTYISSLIVQDKLNNKQSLNVDEENILEFMRDFKNLKTKFMEKLFKLDIEDSGFTKELINELKLFKNILMIKESNSKLKFLKNNLIIDNSIFNVEENTGELSITKSNVLRLIKPRSDSSSIASKAIQNIIVPFPGFESVPFDDNYYYTDKTKSYGASYQLYIQSLRIVAVLLSEYEKTKNMVFLYKAEELIYSWITYVGKGTDERMVWYDHPTANRTQVLIHYLYLVQDTDIDVDYDLFRAVLVKHAEVLSNDDIYFNNNHGLMMDKSLMVLGHVLKEEKYFIKGYYRSVDTFWYSFSSKGTHLENSPDYHNMVVRMYEELQQYLVNNDKSYNENILGILEIAKNYLNIIVKPDMRLPSIGDSGASPRKGNKSYDNFYDIESGMSVLQYNGIKPFYLNFICGYSSKTHKHKDDLSININYNGEDFITDPGKFNYNSKSPIRKYMVSKQSHSSFQLSKYNYQIKRSNRFTRQVSLDGYNFNNEISIVKGFNKDHSNIDVTLKRAVIQINNLPISIIYDYIENPDSNKLEFTQNFNLGNDIKPEYSIGLYILKGKKENLVIKQLLSTDSHEIVKGNEQRPVAVNTVGFSKVKESSQVKFYKKTAKKDVFLTAIYDESEIGKIKLLKLDNRLEIKIGKKVYIINI